MANINRNQQDAYFRKALDWFEAKHGADNVLSAVTHRDETTPHLQLLVIPSMPAASSTPASWPWQGHPEQDADRDFAREIGQDFRLERGRERSQPSTRPSRSTTPAPMRP